MLSKSTSILLILFSLFAISCANPGRKELRAGPENWGSKAKQDPYIINHIVTVNKYGWPLPPKEKEGDPFTTREAYLRHFTNVVEQVIRTAPEVNGVKQILIFAHGGLNGHDSRIGRVKRLLADDSGITNYYGPVFINWSSGFFSTYWEHLRSVRQGRLSNRNWGLATSPLSVVADLGRGVTSLPYMLAEQTKRDVQGLRYPRGPWHTNTHLLLHELQKTNISHVSLGCAKGADFDVRDALWVPLLPIRAATSAILDGGGEPSWENMRRRTKTMYRNSSEFNPIFEANWESNNVERAREVLLHPPTGGVSEFMRVLESKLTNSWAGKYEITLVGHSMGAIVLSEVIRSYHTLKFKNIVFMGAACTIRDFETSILPYMEESADTKFYNLCLHPLAESQEDLFWQTLPRGSLLQWIDNILSTPEFPTDRTLGAWENVVLAYKIIPPHLRDRVHIKAFDNELRKASRAPNYVINPFNHGDFGKAEFWKKEFWQPVSHECSESCH